MLHIRERVDELRKKESSFSFDNVLNDLEKAIEDFGVKVYYSDMSAFPDPEKVSGYTMLNEKGEPEIIVNVNEPEGRRRFTMAHELGHIILHWGWPENEVKNNPMTILYRQDSSYKDYRSEREANEFAAQLLAPLDVIEQVLIEPISSYDSPSQEFLSARIAEAFNITKSFAGVQLKKLDQYQNA